MEYLIRQAQGLSVVAIRINGGGGVGVPTTVILTEQLLFQGGVLAIAFTDHYGD